MSFSLFAFTSFPGMYRGSRSTSPWASFTVHKNHCRSFCWPKEISLQETCVELLQRALFTKSSNIKHKAPAGFWTAQCCVSKRWSRSLRKPGANTHQGKLPWNYPLGSACWDEVEVLCIINLHLFGNKWQISPFVFSSPVNAWTWGLLSMQCLRLADEVTSSSGHDLLHLGDILHQPIQPFYL